MPAETVELTTKPRRSTLALMVRRVPFTLLLRGCSIDGVQVTRRLRGALDRCRFFLAALIAMVAVGGTVAAGIGSGLGDSAFLAGCTFSVILCGVALLLLRLHPGVLAKREAAAKKMPRDLFETA